VSSVPTERDKPAETVAGFLSVIAIVAALFSLAYRPIRLDPFALVVAFIAAGIGGRHARLAAIAVAVATVCFIAAMVIAVLTKRALY
jgi:hypothetical protein